MKLYTFHASGSAHRARMALALKGIDYEPVYVVIGQGSTDLVQPDYLAMNPSAVVPTLVDGDNVITQTMAIMEYLEESRPEPALLPPDSAGRARVRAMTQVMIADTHALGTVRVLEYLDKTLEQPDEARKGWARHWNERGFEVVEKMLAEDEGSGRYCHGDQPTMADIALVSQIFVSRKFGVDLASFPSVKQVYENCMELPAFSDSVPQKQPDAPAAG